MLRYKSTQIQKGATAGDFQNIEFTTKMKLVIISVLCWVACINAIQLDFSVFTSLFSWSSSSPFKRIVFMTDSFVGEYFAVTVNYWRDPETDFLALTKVSDSMVSLNRTVNVYESGKTSGTDVAHFNRLFDLSTTDTRMIKICTFMVLQDPDVKILDNKYEVSLFFSSGKVSGPGCPLALAQYQRPIVIGTIGSVSIIMTLLLGNYFRRAGLQGSPITSTYEDSKEASEGTPAQKFPKRQASIVKTSAYDSDGFYYDDTIPEDSSWYDFEPGDDTSPYYAWEHPEDYDDLKKSKAKGSEYPARCESTEKVTIATDDGASLTSSVVLVAALTLFL